MQAKEWEMEEAGKKFLSRKQANERERGEHTSKGVGNGRNRIVSRKSSYQGSKCAYEIKGRCREKANGCNR